MEDVTFNYILHERLLSVGSVIGHLIKYPRYE